MRGYLFLFYVFLFGALGSVLAQTATITGVVLDENDMPLTGVNVTTAESGSASNADGFYILELIADRPTDITFSHVGHKNVVLNALILTTNETYQFNPVLKTDAIQIAEVTVSASGERRAEGVVALSPETVRKIPGANAGVENILKLLPGVSSNNELSTQYAVRGGNYDENLVYVNEIEVYRPFLLRSAQQEGLSFVNSDLVQGVKFSSGGFQAKYGDKLSSVLDITYKNPVAFGATLDLSFLGAAASVETVSKDKNFSGIMGLRYRNNNLLLNTLETQTNLTPTFVDMQGYFTYRFSKKFYLNFLGTLSVNDYQNEPINRETTFGTLDDPRRLTVFYQGQENNRFNTALGAFKGNYIVNEQLTLKLISSLYHTTEQEYSDVIAQYELGDVDTNLGSDNLGNVVDSKGVGSELNRARNDLDALIFNLQHKGRFAKNKKVVEWGVKYSYEDIRDRIKESEFIDSVGFFVRPLGGEFVNDQPETPFEAPIAAFEALDETNFVQTDRFSGFVQYSDQTDWNGHDIYYNLGVRGQHWSVRGQGIETVSQTVWSPRGQFAIKPDWKRDILFRFSTGLYQQPPFYRELRDQNGIINPNVDAQRSLHAVLGSEYSFTMGDKPFTLTAETYYKKLSNVNPYTLEDVRIRYAADNNAEAYAYGAELRMNGAFVPGTESWFSLGYLKTEENIDDRGYISRPSDQRLKVGILFQDYIPAIPNLKMYLNLVYNTGVPGGSPNNADPYLFQSRLRDYRRADLGISYIFVDNTKKYLKNHWLNRFKELSGGFEIFNLFNTQNSITNTWVRDVDTRQQFAVPNFLTSRVLNVKLRMRF